MEIGRFFGAQTIVSGAVSSLGDGYRIRIRALEVQTVQVQGQYNRNIAASPIVTALVKSGGAAAGTTTATASRPAQTTTGAQTVQPAPQPRTPVTPLRWSIGDFKDQWGDSTGIKYVEYDGQVTADYADFWGPQRVVIRNIRFSRSQGLTFQSGKLESFTDWNAEMFLKASSGDEKRFRGRNYSNGSVRFEFSQDLANFLTDPEVKVMLVIGGDNSRYLFDFPPRFRDAYELLLSREVPGPDATRSSVDVNNGENGSRSSTATAVRARSSFVDIGSFLYNFIGILLVGGFVAYCIWGPSLSTAY
jgi:hypothetical protein